MIKRFKRRGERVRARAVTYSSVIDDVLDHRRLPLGGGCAVHGTRRLGCVRGAETM
jgi:hypothetical protein